MMPFRSFAGVKNAPPNPYAIFSAFTRHIQLDLKLQDKLKMCNSPEQIICIALSLGFNISKEDLMKVASDLTADCFPWAGK